MSRYSKYFLLAVFLSAILLIVFLQFNSNRSINRLIYGNENLLQDLNIKTDLQHLQTDVLALETKLRGAVISGQSADTGHFFAEINNLRSTFQRLSVLKADTVIQPLLYTLHRLIDEKIAYNRNVLDTYQRKGKKDAETIINDASTRELNDSIRQVILRIDDLHQLNVTSLIEEADINGQKARTLGTFMAFIAALASIFTFAYISFRMQQQQRLIARLNISERKAKEAVRIKENFLANMSHEIRTPLNAVLGFTGLLQNRVSDPDSKEYVQNIQRSGDNLLNIVNDILDLSKIEAGMMRVESAPFSIRGLLHSVETMFRLKAEEKKLRFTVSIDENIPDILEGDAVRLTQILVNLIGNALKFTNDGAIAVNVEDQGAAGDRINIGITVTDTGIGIEKEKLGLVFERFRQAEDAVTRKYGGTGLGLSIVSELVALQQGTISAQSEPGKGTKVFVSLPYTIALSQISLPPAENMTEEKTTIPGGGRVLIVEDNEINQTLMKHLFSGWKIGFDIVANGREALEALRRLNYDLVLMDIQMPEMDGYTTTLEIRNTLKLETPVIAMTAHAMAGERERCIGYGMNDYIAKPIREPALRQIVARFIAGKSTGMEINLQPTVMPRYRFIDLQYMKDVSQGNRDYEETVTSQFLEMIPQDIAAMKIAWQARDSEQIKRIAHNMKTSVSVMGLNRFLDPFLNVLEHSNPQETETENILAVITCICEAALEESSAYLKSLAGD